MITINNIEKIIGMISFGNTIIGVTTDDPMHMSGDYYIFKFKNDFQQHKVAIYLNRHSEKNNGKYDMFVMGWGASTRIYINKRDMNYAFELAEKMNACLELLEVKH